MLTAAAAAAAYPLPTPNLPVPIHVVWTPIAIGQFPAITLETPKVFSPHHFPPRKNIDPPQCKHHSPPHRWYNCPSCSCSCLLLAFGDMSMDSFLVHSFRYPHLCHSNPLLGILVEDNKRESLLCMGLVMQMLVFYPEEGVERMWRTSFVGAG